MKQFISAPVSVWFFDLHHACRVTLGMLLLLVLPGTSGVVNAATPNDYPARPVRLISPFAPGGGNDLISRTLGQEMSKNLGQPVVVDNRPGANAIIGMQIVATAPAARSPVMPDLPTVAESGVPGYEASTWYGLLAPARTPRTIVMRLNAETKKALAAAEVRERFAAAGADPVGNSPDQFAAYVRTESAKWAKVIKLSGIKPE